ncbi:MAG: glycogen debranching N-terminal domain-containing protein, partial [Nitrospiraceae bacterium]
MAVEVKVGPAVITINHGHTFLISEFDGSVTNASDQGLYSRDTRYVSCYQLFIDGNPWTLLNSGASAYFTSRTYLVNPRVTTDEGLIAPGLVGLVITRTVADAFHEDLDIHNYSARPLRFTLEMLIRSDFADIFEVKSNEVTRRGNIETAWNSTAQQLTTHYQNGGFRRSLSVHLARSTSQAGYGNGRINFAIDLTPHGAWHCCCLYGLGEGDMPPRTLPHCATAFDTSETAQSLSRWKEETTHMTTSNEDWYRLYRQSVEDMAALRLPINDCHPRTFVPAAGVPWFVSIFGRDSLLVSLQNMMVFPGF